MKKNLSFCRSGVKVRFLILWLSNKYIVKVKIFLSVFIYYRSGSSNKRIILSSLYLGTGEKEVNLVKSIETSLQQKSDMKTRVLLDWCRGKD